MIEIKVPKGKQIYFTSDHHFGAPSKDASKPREVKFIKWLDQIKKDADTLFIVGDLFDFWFEYKYVIPKGFTRVLGKLAELSDQGVKIHFFVGNHDMWMKGYLEQEIGMRVYLKPQQFKLNKKIFFIGHGDGLGPNDKDYKRLKKIFTNSFFRWVFRWIHPDLGVRLAHYMSLKSKLISGSEDLKFLGDNEEWLVKYSKRKLEDKHYDYFVFGHRHLPLKIEIPPKSTYVNLGDWITHYTFGIFDGEKLFLKEFEN
tara:strand:- start:50604 stop:51371 length:768 start_codon:yes stop_codon:yes gene_type:complete